MSNDQSTYSSIGGVAGAFAGEYTIGGPIGSMVGVWVGSMIGSWLYGKFSSKHKPYNQETSDINTITRLDNLPYLIGTDICPGQLVWFGQMGLMDSATMRSEEIYDTGSSYFSSYYKPLDSRFAIAFCQNASRYYGAGRQGYINRLFFDTKDIWHYALWLGELLRWEKNTKNTYFDAVNPIRIVKNTMYGYASKDYLLLEPNPDVPHSFFTWFSYDGWFGDFSLAEQFADTLGENIPDAIEDNKKAFKKTIALKRFPDITGEVSSYHAFYSGEAFQNYDRIGHYGTIHCSRDGLHEYYYFYIWSYKIYNGECCIYAPRFYAFHPYLGNRVVMNFPPDEGGGDYLDAYDYMLGWHKNMSLSRTDEWDNRIYFFTGRLHDAKFEWRHHAPWSLAYDIFYIDRSDPFVPISLKLDEKITGLNHFDTGNCAFNAHSMEITKNGKILVFGHMAQDAFPLYDTLIVTQNTVEPGTRIYLDLSGYANNWWLNKYAWSSDGCPRKIINQTSTYIDIESADPDLLYRHDDFWVLPQVGDSITLCYTRTYDREYVIPDIGSTRTMLICNCPVSDIKTDDDGKFDCILMWYNNYTYNLTIDYGLTNGQGTPDSTAIYLTDAMPRDPIPGEKLLLFFEGTTTYDQSVVNPILPYTDYIEHSPTGYWRFNQVNSGDSNIVAVLQFDKETGEFEGLIHKTLVVNFWNGVWDLAFTTDNVNSLILTCATENEIFAHYVAMQTPSCGKICEWIIDSNILEFTHIDCGGNNAWNEDELWESNPYSCGHAWGSVHAATAWLWVMDENTNTYIKQWYSVCYDYADLAGGSLSGGGGMLGAGGLGTIKFLKLNNNRFFNNSLTLLKRPVVFTGPMYSGWWFNASSAAECYRIAKCGIENKLFVGINHSFDGGFNEVWSFESPTVQNPNGVLRCISVSGEDWTNAISSGSYGALAGISWASTFSSTFEFHGIGGHHAYSYYRDENPVDALVRILQSDSIWYSYYYFPYSLYSGLVYSSASSSCAAVINAQVYCGNDLVTFKEPRYQYSMCLDTSQPIMDIARDIMQSCMGWLFPCGRKLKIHVPTSTETPVFAFGLESSDHYFYPSMNIPAYPQSSSYVSYYDPIYLIIPIDLSDYPLGYFVGEMGSFVYDSVEYEFVVIEHSTNDKIKVTFYYSSSGYYSSDLYYFLSHAYSDGIWNFTTVLITIKAKDNIKEGSFTFSQKSKLKNPNTIRIEYKDRLKGYVTEIAESKSDYSRQNDGYDKIQTYKMHGIKRGTQANRVVQQLMDYMEFVEWNCALETDACGMYLCPGDIVTVTHPVTGWFGKWFRIMSMEETEQDFNTKFELEEYNPYVYHDVGDPLTLTNTYGGFTPSGINIPLPLSNLSIFEDNASPNLYISFRDSSSQSNLIGVKLYRVVGSTYEFVEDLYFVPITMFLDEALSDSKFDNDYIKYSNLIGTLPLSGLIWIGTELISYNGVDALSGKLMNIVRGYADTPIASHSVGDLITVLGSTNFVSFPESWIGSRTFKVTPLIYGNTMVADINSAPSFTITIVGYGYKPHFPESLRLRINRVESTSLNIDSIIQKIISKQPVIDSLINKLSIEKSLSIDSILGILGLKQTDIDSLINKLGINKLFSIDSLINKLSIEKSLSMDAILIE